MTQPEPTAAPALPTHITHAQLLAACEALGLDAAVTAGFNLTLMVGTETVTVIQYEHNEDGRVYLVGDKPAMNTTHIPVAESYEDMLQREQQRRVNRLLGPVLTPDAPVAREIGERHV